VLVAGIAVQESETVAGRAERCRAVRVFAREVLRASVRDAAALLMTELFAASVLHGCSASAGDTVTVISAALTHALPGAADNSGGA
jgi:hypothetical protein